MVKPFYISTCEDRATNQQGVAFIPFPEQPLEPFLIQDPFRLRKAVVPVFKRNSNGEIDGMGTAFHIDGWGTFLSADHVIDFSREFPKSASSWTDVSPNSNGDHPVLFLGMGLIVGIVNIPKESFAFVSDIVSTMREKDDPILNLKGKTEPENAADLAVLTAVFEPGTELPHSLPVKGSDWYPSIGEWVLAIGFPELRFVANILSEGMYGAYGRIKKIYPHGSNNTHPTPVFEVECNWPSGMSGGPVFNMSGEVVGLVSRSLQPSDDLPGSGMATYFHLIHDFDELVPTLDSLNPGCRRGWAVLRSNPWHLAGFFKTEAEAIELAKTMSSDYQVKYGSNRFGTDDFIS